MTVTPSRSNSELVLAMTGASGAIYAMRLLQVLIGGGLRVHLSISPSAALVLGQELGVELDLNRFKPQALPIAPDSAAAASLPPAMAAVLAAPERALSTGSRPGEIVYHHFENLMAPIASGSFLTGGMVI
jgi:4-hydroxy-3-polyprenylbenzoate decarboxylase